MRGVLVWKGRECGCEGALGGGVDLVCWKCSVSCPQQHQYIGLIPWKCTMKGSHIKGAVLSLTNICETIAKEKFNLKKKQVVENNPG